MTGEAADAIGSKPKGRGVAFKAAGVVDGVHVWTLTLPRPRLGKGVYTGAIEVGSKLTRLKYRS